MQRFDMPEKGSFQELGLRHSSEVVSTNYILKTVQDQSAVNLVRVYSSSFNLFSNTFSLLLSVFLIIWWCLHYPEGEWTLWFFILTSVLYCHLLIDLSISLYYSKTKLRLMILASVIFVSAGSVSISFTLSETLGFFTMTLGIVLIFVILIFNVIRNCYYRHTKKIEGNFAKKIMNLYILQEESKEENEKNSLSGKKKFVDEDN